MEKSNVERGQAMEMESSTVKVANPKTIRSSDFLLRLLALATTLVAAVVMGLAKETKVFQVPLIPGVSVINMTVPAKMRYSSALVYFVVANAISCAYSAFSLVASMGVGSRGKGLALMITIVDVIIVGLLFSANGAAATIGVLGYKGNSHVNWNKVCDVYGKFCRSVAASIVVSLIGSIIFVLLVVLSLLHLHRRSR